MGFHTYEHLNANRPKPIHNSSSLRNAIATDNSFSDVESSLVNSNDKFDRENNTIIIELLDIKTNNESQNKKSKKQMNKSNTAKNVSFSDVIFD